MLLEVMIVQPTTSRNSSQRLRSVFATHGFPEILVSDNGTTFTSEELQEFVRRNGIWHITSVPYLPASNVLAVGAVQTLRPGLRKGTSADDMEMQQKKL